MANQITVQVYAIDNIPQRTALNVSFPTNQISAQLATSVLASNIQSQINYYPNPNNQAQLTEVLVSQSISDIATLAGNSMFAASIYKINGYPQGGQALNMLFPSVQPSIWNVSGGGDVHSFVQFKGKKYYAHETSAALATAANAGGGGSENLQQVLDNGATLNKVNNIGIVGAGVTLKKDDNNIILVQDNSDGGIVKDEIYNSADGIMYHENYSSSVSNTRSFSETNFEAIHYTEAAQFFHRIDNIEDDVHVLVKADTNQIELKFLQTSTSDVTFGININRTTGIQFIISGVTYQLGVTAGAVTATAI